MDIVADLFIMGQDVSILQNGTAMVTHSRSKREVKRVFSIVDIPSVEEFDRQNDSPVIGKLNVSTPVL